RSNGSDTTSNSTFSDRHTSSLNMTAMLYHRHMIDVSLAGDYSRQPAMRNVRNGAGHGDQTRRVIAHGQGFHAETSPGRGGRGVQGGGQAGGGRGREEGIARSPHEAIGSFR